YGPNDDFDDLRGYPAGHFVVVSGYDSETNQVLVNDPLMDNPYSPKQQYNVKIEKLICSILLGVLTYDAKLLIIEPKKSMTYNVYTNSSKQSKRLEIQYPRSGSSFQQGLLDNFQLCKIEKCPYFQPLPELSLPKQWLLCFTSCGCPGAQGYSEHRHDSGHEVASRCQNHIRRVRRTDPEKFVQYF